MLLGTRYRLHLSPPAYRSESQSLSSSPRLSPQNRSLQTSFITSPLSNSPFSCTQHHSTSEARLPEGDIHHYATTAGSPSADTLIHSPPLIPNIPCTTVNMSLVNDGAKKKHKGRAEMKQSNIGYVSNLPVRRYDTDQFVSSESKPFEQLPIDLHEFHFCQRHGSCSGKGLNDLTQQKISIEKPRWMVNSSRRFRHTIVGKLLCYIFMDHCNVLLALLYPKYIEIVFQHPIPFRGIPVILAKHLTYFMDKVGHGYVNQNVIKSYCSN